MRHFIRDLLEPWPTKWLMFLLLKLQLVLRSFKNLKHIKIRIFVRTPSLAKLISLRLKQINLPASSIYLDPFGSCSTDFSNSEPSGRFKTRWFPIADGKLRGATHQSLILMSARLGLWFFAAKQSNLSALWHGDSLSHVLHVGVCALASLVTNCPVTLVLFDGLPNSLHVPSGHQTRNPLEFCVKSR